jgi:hypothetical protein
MLDATFGPYNDEASLRRFQCVTGNWGELLYEVGRRCQQGGLHRWAEHLKDLETELEQAVKWRDSFSLVREAIPVLQVLSQLGEPLETGEVTGLGDNLSESLVETVLAWGDLLRFVRKAPQDTWDIDPVVRRLVLAGV